MSGNPVMCVTGANRGIGLELARQYLADGWNVIATVRSMDISDELAAVLEAYPNLFVDLSWSMLTPYLLDEQGKPRAEWLKLVERFPERFMLGSDVVGRFNKLGKEMHRFDVFLDALPEGVAQKVARDNFLAILPKPRGDEGAR